MKLFFIDGSKKVIGLDEDIVNTRHCGNWIYTVIHPTVVATQEEQNYINGDLISRGLCPSTIKTIKPELLPTNITQNDLSSYCFTKRAINKLVRSRHDIKRVVEMVYKINVGIPSESGRYNVN